MNRISNRLEQDGRLLFGFRSFLPLVLVPVGAIALFSAPQMEQVLGGTFEDVWTYGSLAISISGLLVRWLTIGTVPAGTSGRSTSDMRADTLNTTGMYSVVRNPLYLGNFLAFVGLILAIKVWWFALVCMLVYWLYIERIIAAEERFLSDKYGVGYENWTTQTPVFCPDLRLWKKPSLAFSIRNVARREYNGLFVIVSAFLIQEMAIDILIEGERFRVWFESDRFWVLLWVSSAAIFVVCRTLKRHTSVLDVPGRR